MRASDRLALDTADVAGQERQQADAEADRAGLRDRLAVSGALQADVADLESEELHAVEGDARRPDRSVDVDAGDLLERLLGGDAQPFRADARSADSVNREKGKQDKRSRGAGDAEQHRAGASGKPVSGRFGRGPGGRKTCKIGDLVAPELYFFVPR